jgi:tetratricopeptide (TPR) repeat protein
MMRALPCFLAFCCVLRMAAQERSELLDVPFDEAHFTDAAGLKQALADIRKGDRLAYKDGLDHEAAMAAYRAAEAFNPANGDLQRRMGICLLNGPDPASALPHLQRAVELNPYLPRVHYLLGFAHQLNGQWDQALAEYQKHEAVLRLSPDVDPTFARTDLRMAECRAGKALSAKPATARGDRHGAWRERPPPMTTTGPCPDRTGPSGSPAGAPIPPAAR